MERPISTISDVEMTASLSRRILLFGSFRQFTSYFLFLLLIFLACSFFMGPDTPRAQFIVTMMGAFLGTLPALITVLPARFSIAAAGTAVDAWLRDIDSKLYWMGYKRAERGEGIRYEHRLPWWLRWTENSFDIGCEDGRILVAGPIFAARRLRRELAAKAG